MGLARAHVNRRLYDSMNHHGYDKFQLLLLEDCHSYDIEYVNAREIYWISQLNTMTPNGYNMTIGGDGGNTLNGWSEIDKQKLWERQAMKRRGYTHSDATKQLMSTQSIIREASKSDDERKRISEKISTTNKIKNISPPEYTKWKKGSKGFTGNHTLETKQKLREARIGKTYETIFGVNKATILKGQRRENWIGKNNPNYVEVSIDKKSDIINTLLSKSLTMKQISDEFDITPYLLRNWFRELGISNFQIFNRQDTKTKHNFWRDIIC